MITLNYEKKITKHAYSQSHVVIDEYLQKEQPKVYREQILLENE